MAAMVRPWSRSSCRALSCRWLTTNRVMPSEVTRMSVAAARVSFVARLKGGERGRAALAPRCREADEGQPLAQREEEHLLGRLGVQDERVGDAPQHVDAPAEALEREGKVARARHRVGFQ